MTATNRPVPERVLMLALAHICQGAELSAGEWFAVAVVADRYKVAHPDQDPWDADATCRLVLLGAVDNGVERRCL